MAVPDLVRGHVECISSYCCSVGLNPVLHMTDIKKSELGAIWEEAISKIKSLNLVGNEDFMYPPEITYLCKFIDEVGSEKYLECLLDPLKMVEVASKANKAVAGRIVTTGDDAGMISTEGLWDGQQFFGLDETPMYCFPTKILAFNSTLPLFPHLARTSKKSPILIRPDVFRMNPQGTVHMFMERVANFGRKFDESWLQNLRGREMASHSPSRLQSGDITQFYWEERKGNEVHMACEELPLTNSEWIGEKMLCRFVHAVYKKELRAFDHLDGAIHIYDREGYEQRIGRQLSGHMTNYSKAKIFKIQDIAIPLDEVAAITAEFFRWNQMVPEYFFGEGK
jgi:hypothetical protein